MPKLIIPNIREIYKSPDHKYTQEEAISRQFYSLRFLWLLDPHDIMLLSEAPDEAFLSYLCNIKQISRNTLTIIPWEDTLDASFADALANPVLIEKLRAIISAPSQWSIQTCYLNQAVINLADNLNISIRLSLRQIALNDDIRKMNSKVYFRYLASECNIPIPNGLICHSQFDLQYAIHTLITQTGQVIIKQEYNSGSRGNIGITINPNCHFVGITKKLTVTNHSLEAITKQVWGEYIDNINKCLIVEIYHPNTGTFTAMLQIQPLGQDPLLLNYSEIRMAMSWYGIQIPANRLSQQNAEKLINDSFKFASMLQQTGYEGYLCCDVIRTLDNQILFTEINVRPGAETNAHALATHLFGEKHYEKATILTNNKLKVTSFQQAYRILAAHKLLLTAQNKFGVVLLTLDERYSKQVEYFFVAPTLVEAKKMEIKLTQLLS